MALNEYVFTYKAERLKNVVRGEVLNITSLLRWQVLACSKLHVFWRK